MSTDSSNVIVRVVERVSLIVNVFEIEEEYRSAVNVREFSRDWDIGEIVAVIDPKAPAAAQSHTISASIEHYAMLPSH
jgi:hypothetical protein